MILKAPPPTQPHSAKLRAHFLCPSRYPLALILRQASTDSRGEVSPISRKFKLVCKSWRNAVDNDTRATLLGLLKNKNVLLRHNDRFYRVERWRFPGTQLKTDAVREAIRSELESAITKKSPLRLRLIAPHLITDTPVAYQLTFAVEPVNGMWPLSVISATVRQP